jgi:putative FmdB family regulatory protein
MPIYEYECTKCGHYLEALQKIADKPLRECPECGKHALKRLVSAPMFRLSGSGWYETDFKSDQEKKRNLTDKGDKEPAAEAKPATATESKGDSKTDAKTEAQSESKRDSKPESKDSERSGDSRPSRSRSLSTKASQPSRPTKAAASRVTKKSKAKAKR